MQEKVNWKKILLFGTVSAFAPVLSNFAESAQAGHAVAFTAGNILAPAAVNAVAIFSALFSNPRTFK